MRNWFWWLCGCVCVIVAAVCALMGGNVNECLGFGFIAAIAVGGGLLAIAATLGAVSGVAEVAEEKLAGREAARHERLARRLADEFERRRILIQDEP